jgi:hypothetical protein
MIDDTALKTVTAKLLFESLTAEDREKLLTTALASLMEPQRTAYSSTGKSRLQERFDDAAGIAAVQLLKEHFAVPEVRERVKVFVVAAMEKAFSEEFVQKLTERMISGLWSER